MSYVLVSLVREDDEATRVSDAFARWYAEQHPPASSFHHESPGHNEVREAVVALDPRLGFVLGHGGSTLRASPGPGVLDVFARAVVWADAAQFAGMFSGSRVYVLACSTLAKSTLETSFGREAVALGVTAYAGHHQPIEAPDVESGSPKDKKLRRGVARVVRMFLDGCDDVHQLLMEARSAMSEKARFRLAPPQGEEFVEGWPLNWQRLFGSLKIEIR